ncbi:YbaN family protein [Lentibacillus sediminis]|uniref:YbaN family protein n=1 Tax=Lentibacillus sediminis TaxID=1940529 RepID=UPI000C1BCFC9|nr:YbaN family protein [Lentibacillus sediminis]
MKHIKRILLVIIGLISFGIGVAGTILPVLPGGPFYLIAAFCFTKSSERLDNWFRSTEVYDKYVVGFREKRGMTRKEKIRINLIADFFIVFSLFMVDILFVQIIIAALGLYKHYYFIKKIKTIKPAEQE